jgi:hypothetical protein
MNITLPPKERPEWIEMVSGNLQHNYKNYVLQTRTYQLQKEVASGKKTQQQAIDELYELCAKYVLAVQPDFKIIFKTW